MIHSSTAPILTVSLLSFALLASPLLGCSSPKKDSQAATTPDWSGKMQELSSALNGLLPLVSDKSQFDDPKNFATIESVTLRLKNLSHQVRGLEKPAADPAFDSIAKMLDEDLARALSALKNGQRDYARLTVRESIGYCIQCHTQTASGPSFPKLDLGFDPSKMSPLAQGDYFAATRQFDSALEAYLKGVKDPGYAKKDIFGWERAASSSLAISVRFKESPKEAKAITRAIISNKQASPSMQEAAKGWASSIDRWSREKKNRFKGDNARLDRAASLIAEADAGRESRPARSSDILFLRASADLHKWLGDHPAQAGTDRTTRAKALFLAGRAAEELRELNFWTLHERYYELCIETAPATELAKNCFKLLNDSVLMGYTGSSGLRLPHEESMRLSKLKSKAFGEKTSAP